MLNFSAKEIGLNSAWGTRSPCRISIHERLGSIEINAPCAFGGIYFKHSICNPQKYQYFMLNLRFFDSFLYLMFRKGTGFVILGFKFGILVLSKTPHKILIA